MAAKGGLTIVEGLLTSMRLTVVFFDEMEGMTTRTKVGQMTKSGWVVKTTVMACH